MANGARKGGDSAVFETLANAEPRPVLWQEHAATRNPQSNRPDRHIANPDTRPDRAFDLDVLIYANGRMQVTNTRSGYAESYPAP
jgi:hypothetical protein